jgi:3D (Asp-Asp-Asp) domain-containing protein
MKRILSRSHGRKAAALVIAIIGFVLAYETQMFDSQSGPWQAIMGNGAPQPGSKLNFDATAYCKGSTTASGVTARTGVAAADAQLLPVGSVVNIATGDLKYNGVYTIMDTGPKVQGRILDLYMWNCNEALTFGRRNVQITVLRLGWDPQASAPTLVDRLFRRREAARRVPPPDPPPPAGIAPEPAVLEAGVGDGASAKSAPAASDPAAAKPTSPVEPTAVPPKPE